MGKVAPSLVSNLFWNLLGAALPLVTALLSFPYILKGLGSDRVGILMLIWVLTGFNSIFDFGLGRALTAIIASSIGKAKVAVARRQAFTGLSLAFGVGLLCAGATWCSIGLIFHHLLDPLDTLRMEATDAGNIAAAGVLITVLSVAVRGVTEGHQDFRSSNIFRLLLGFWILVSPLFALGCDKPLVASVVLLVVGRIALVGYQLFVCRHWITAPANFTEWRQDAVALGGSGGWMAISNVINPLMNSVDRWLIGLLVSAGAVASYAVPSELITKQLVYPAALTGVLFAAFANRYSASGSSDSRAGLADLLDKGMRLIVFGLLPALFLLTTLGADIITLWLGDHVSPEMGRVTQILALGVYANGMAQLPYAVLQATGRSRLTALNHLAQAPLFLAIAYPLTSAYGAVGMAAAWTIRVAVDGLLLCVQLGRLEEQASRVMRSFAILLVAPLAISSIAVALVPPASRAYSFAILMLLFLLLAGLYLVQIKDIQLLARVRRAT